MSRVPNETVILLHHLCHTAAFPNPPLINIPYNNHQTVLQCDPSSVDCRVCRLPLCFCIATKKERNHRLWNLGSPSPRPYSFCFCGELLPPCSFIWVWVPLESKAFFWIICSCFYFFSRVICWLLLFDRPTNRQVDKPSQHHNKHTTASCSLVTTIFLLDTTTQHSII